MLNEFAQVRNALRQSGINTQPLHRKIQKPSKGKKLCVLLTADNKIGSMAVLSAEVVANAWKLADGNKNSFPFVRLSNGILKVERTEDEIKKRLNKNRPLNDRLEYLLELTEESVDCDITPDNWSKYRDVLSERRTLLDGLADEYSVVPAAFSRFLAATEDWHSVRKQLIETGAFMARTTPSPDLLDLLIELMVKGGAQICIDAEGDDFDYAITDPELEIPVSNALSTEHIDNAEATGVCAISGEHVELLSGTFPNPKLPQIGVTPLFARKQDVECRHRYGRKGTDTFRIGLKLSRELSAGAKAITAPNREGLTWATIPSEVRKNPDLLIAYVAACPDFDVAASFTEDRAKEGEFEEKAKRVSQAFRARQLDQKEEPRLRLIVLRKVDTANRKVIYSDEKSVDRLLKACDEWVAVCRGVPKVTLPVPMKNDEPAKRMTPFVIPPASLVAMTKQQYTRDGEGQTDVVGGRYSEALDLFWGSDYAKQRAAKMWLRLLISRRRLLLIGIAQALRVPHGKLKTFDLRGALSTITALHIVLHRLDRKGDIYMNDAGFKLGQLLAAADELHCGYCHDVRNGSIPSRLMGNAIVPMAEKNPQQALTVLCGRWPVYVAWAKKKGNFAVNEKYRSTKGKKLSKKEYEEKQKQWAIAKGVSAYRKAKPIAESLQNKLSSTSKDEFRAELILGYIAGFSATHNDSADINPNEGAQNE